MKTRWWKVIDIKIPQHIAIIMDGNGRWAKKMGLDISKGHEEGVKTVRRIVEAAREINVSYLTLYTFSSENWKRSMKEVSALMSLLRTTVFSEIADLIDNDVRIVISGDLSGLPLAQRKAMQYAMDRTKNCKSLVLNLALNYGGRQEIVRAVKTLAEQAVKGELDINSINDEAIEQNLYTAGIPDPDLMIRTGGDHRISNFLLWQLSYTELLFIETLWPDFCKDDFKAAVMDFAKRDRRFGGRPEE